jgi:hypothetical protein
MRVAVDLHEDLVQVPAPLNRSPHPIHPFAPDLGGEHRTEPVPPEPGSFMTQVDAALVQKVLDIPPRQREPDSHHDRQVD